MQRKTHPSKNILYLIGAAVLLGGIVVAVVLASTLQNALLAYSIAGAIVVGDTIAFLMIRQSMYNSLVCPTCDKPLERDRSALASKEYPCESCDTVWVV